MALCKAWFYTREAKVGIPEPEMASGSPWCISATVYFLCLTLLFSY